MKTVSNKPSATINYCNQNISRKEYSFIHRVGGHGWEVRLAQINRRMRWEVVLDGDLDEHATMMVLKNAI